MLNIRVLLLSILLVLCVGLTLIVWVKNKYLIMKLIISFTMIFTFFFVGSIINLNTLSTNEVKRLEKVVDECSDKYIDTKGNSIYVTINGKRVDVNKIKIINCWSKNSTVYVDNVEVELDSPGIKNTICVLRDYGFVE